MPPLWDWWGVVEVSCRQCIGRQCIVGMRPACTYSRIAYEILTDGHRWLGHRHRGRCWGGDSIGGVCPPAGIIDRDVYIYMYTHIYIYVYIYIHIQYHGYVLLSACVGRSTLAARIEQLVFVCVLWPQNGGRILNPKPGSQYYDQQPSFQICGPNFGPMVYAPPSAKSALSCDRLHLSLMFSWGWRQDADIFKNILSLSTCISLYQYIYICVCIDM